MAAQSSGRNSRNYNYFNPNDRTWDIDTNIINRFEFVNYLNKNHNRNDTLYLIYDFIPKLKNDHILPITINKGFAITNDGTKLSTKNLMPQYISGASQLKDVSVNVFEINLLIKIYGTSKFYKMDIFTNQIIKKDNQNKKAA